MSAHPTIHHISQPVLVLVGPTAVGKTSLSLEIAERFQCEIISMDSMQVYRYMDIGTAKVALEERQKIAHHLIDIRNPDEQYDASLFVEDALSAIDDIIKRGKIPLITGGTGLYLNSLVHGLFKEIAISDTARKKVELYFRQQGREAAFKRLEMIDPGSAARIHINDTQRLKRGLEIYEATGKTWSTHLQEQSNEQQHVCFDNLVMTGIRCDRNLLSKRIALRTHQMMKQGFINEVEHLLQLGYGRHLASMQSIGYKQVVQFLKDEMSLEQAIDDIVLKTRRYAKRQFTWFGKNKELLWFDKGNEKKLLDMVEKKITYPFD